MEIKFTVKAVPRKVEKPKKKSKLMYCICSEEGNDYYANVNLASPEKTPNIIKLPFTDKSHSLVGRKIVFSKAPDKEGHYIKRYRDAMQARNFPGSSETYTPFRHNYVYSGYIVEIGNKQLFDMEDIVQHVSNCFELVNFNL